MKISFLFVMFFCFTFSVFAQSESSGYSIEGDRSGKSLNLNTDWMDKFYLGGGLNSLFFSEQETLVGFSVLGGYRWTDKLNTGLGISYQYYERKDLDVKSNLYGFELFSQYGPVEGLLSLAAI